MSRLSESPGFSRGEEVNFTTEMPLHTCRRCEMPVRRNGAFNTDNGLHVTFDGSYGEFIDTPDPIEFVLCHDCAHVITKKIGLDVHNWHTHRPDSGQHADHDDGVRDE